MADMAGDKIYKMPKNDKSFGQFNPANHLSRDIGNNYYLGKAANNEQLFNPID